jgi:hypothetical protein
MWGKWRWTSGRKEGRGKEEEERRALPKGING